MNQKMRRRRRSGRKAFTLLEILLVVGLLALLASVAIPALFGQGEKAKEKMAEAAVKSSGTLSRMIGLFKFNTGVYPEELKYLVEKPNDDDIAEKWTGPYIEDISGLTDPWGNEYQYSSEGRHNEGKFDLWSMGIDGVDGNEDDITNWKDDR